MSKKSKDRTGERSKLIEGIIRRNPKGFGWLEQAGSDVKGIFIPPREMNFIMDGDRVRCRIEPDPKGPVGYVEQIVSRGVKTLIGSFRRHPNRFYVEPNRSILGVPLLISNKFQREARDLADGTLVEVEIVDYPSRHQEATARILRVLGQEGDFSAKVGTILIDSGVPREFSREVENQALTFEENPSEKEKQGRQDLTQIALCTIDGETAKDFDDAVYAEHEGDSYKVVIAIADVAHYVKMGSPIDCEAYERGTSIYYPGACIPMIPEQLSNGLCSLKPNVPRLCMAVEMLISPKGAIQKTSFSEAVMHSQARLTYTQVQAYLDSKWTPMREIPTAVGESIQVLVKASRALRKVRKSKGAIDFDVVESLVALGDNGEPIAINPRERLEAHRLIEDLMVAANEAVAKHLESKKWPTIFRIHEPPSSEKLKNFLTLSQKLGAITPAQYKSLEKADEGPKPLSNMMAHLKDHPAKVALDTLLLRSMMQAKYSSHNLGHYGLASKSYLHFTSPIRRYPDLVSHRVLKEWMHTKKKKLTEDDYQARTEDLEEMAVHCSDRERKAVDIERKMASLHAAWLMKDKVGETDEGVITGCTEFGLFIRLTKYHVEGLLHVTALKQGYMIYDTERMRLMEKNRGRTYEIGDKLKVKVLSVNVDKCFIDLGLVPDDHATARKKRGKI